MWFKSDISIYEREDFQMAWEECNCLSVVWEWLQRESVKAKQDTIQIKNSLYLKGILKKLHISEAEFRDAQRLLGEMELIIFDEPNIITLPNWLLNQGSYFAEKAKNTAKLAAWREKQKQDKSKTVTVTQELHTSYETHSNGYETECNLPIEEEIKSREEKIRVEENIIFPPNPQRGQYNQNSPNLNFPFKTETPLSSSQEEDFSQQTTKGAGDVKTEKAKRARDKFIPPTQNEIVSYLLESQSQEHPKYRELPACELFAKRWLAYYEANGFRISGRTPMKDWKGAVRTWLLRDKDYQPAATKPDKTEQDRRECESILDFMQFAQELRGEAV